MLSTPLTPLRAITVPDPRTFRIQLKDPADGDTFKVARAE